MYLIDTHSHIYAEEFDGDLAQALARAREWGVGRLLLPAIDGESYERMFALARAEADFCSPMMGLHPTSVNENPLWREHLKDVERLLDSPPEGIAFCAVGEIGLDYYWSEEFKSEQREAFIEQCRMAVKRDLPVAIHTRAAWDDMCEILQAETARATRQGGRLRGVLHAFSESADVYRRLKASGDWLFGIGGVVTFKKSIVAEAVAEMELADMVLETDCPYLTPVPYRGRRNESAYVKYVCEKVAQIKGVSADEVAEMTSRNAERMFGLALDARP